MYTIEYHSAIKNNEILPFATTWWTWKVLHLVKQVRQRKTVIIYISNLKIKQKNEYNKTETDSQI